jgi:hypothetical protein
MADETAKIDDNRNRSLMGVTDNVAAELRNILIDPVTGRVKVTAVIETGGGITDLNGLTGGTQTFSDSDDTNVTLTITSTGTDHEFALGWTGQLAIARGGTGGASATAAFDNLSPVTTQGDIIVRGASNNERLAAGSNGQVLTISGGVPTWATPGSTFDDSAFNIYDNVDNTKIIAFQASGITTGTTRTLTVQDADGTIYITGGQDVAVADGGTGSSTAAGARSNLGAAASGANSDITSLTGLTTALDEIYGGTGLTSYAAGDMIYASGVNTLAKLTAGSNGQVLTLAGGVPTWADAAGGAAPILLNDVDFDTTDAPINRLLYTGTSNMRAIGHPNGVDSSWWFQFMLPNGFSTSADIVFDLGFMDSVGGGNYRLKLEYWTITDGGDTTPASSPTDTVNETIAAPSAVETYKKVTTTTLKIAAADLAAIGDAIILKFTREGADAADTATGEMYLAGIVAYQA